MYESYGSLAYKIPEKTMSVRRRGEQTRHYRKRHRAEPKRVVLPMQSEEERVAAAYHRQAAKQRAGRIAAVVFATTLLAAVFSGVLYRNSQILEMNYANVKIEKEIARIEKEENQIKEELSKKTDLNVIRTLAIERLGMQDPGQRQIVQVTVPEGDRLILGSENEDAAGENAQLSSVLTNIEGFFKTIR